MNLTNIIPLFYVAFDVLILTVYYKIFLVEKIFKQPYIRLGLYLVAIGMYFASSVCLPEAYQRTIVYLSVCFLLSFGYLGALTYKLILVAIYAAIGIIIENMVSFLLQIIEVICGIKLTPDNGYILGTILSCVLFLVVTFCIWLVLKNKCKDLCTQSRLTGSYLDTLFFVMIVITIVISYGIHYLTLQQTMGHGLFFFLALECLLIVFDIVIFFIFRKMELLEKRKLQAVYLEKVTQAQEEFYKESIQKNQKLKRIIHDEKNFLIGLAGLLQEQKVGLAINEIENKVEQLMSNITEYTGIIALDTVLNAKIEKASAFNILIRPAVAVYGELYIDTLDLVLLVGNALDNAIEATEKIEDSLKKYIHLSIKLQDNYLLIEVKNSVHEKVLIQNQFIITTKSDDGLHGFGLENMRALTEKYHGTMLLECDDNFFQVRIVLENERAE